MNYWELFMKKAISIIIITATLLSMMLAVIPTGAVSAEAKSDVILNTSALEAAIRDAEKLEEKKYTTDSWAVLEIVLKTAISALEAEGQEEIDTATAALKLSISNLVPRQVSEETGLIVDKEISKLISKAYYREIYWTSLGYRVLYNKKLSDKVFTDNYDLTITDKMITSKAITDAAELGYVAQSEYPITDDTFYVYEFKAKLNRVGGYAGVVYAVKGNEHYYFYGAFANDGDFCNADGVRMSHLQHRLGCTQDMTGREFYECPALHLKLDAEGYGSWRVIYEGRTIKMQYLTADGEWAYANNSQRAYSSPENQHQKDEWYENAPEISSFTLPVGYYVAFGIHNKFGNIDNERTIAVKDAIFYDCTIIDDGEVTPADKTALDAYIKYVSEKFVSSIEYDAETWATFQKALSAARIASGNKRVSQLTVNEKLEELIAAVSALKINTADLDALIADSKRLIEYNYTRESWKIFADALSVAERTEKIDYKTVLALYNDLLAAKEGLVAVDYSALEKAIAKAEALVADKYTAESWVVFVQVVEASKGALMVPDQNMIDAAVASLNAAMNALVIYVEDEPVEKPTERPTEISDEKPTEEATDESVPPTVDIPSLNTDVQGVPNIPEVPEDLSELVGCGSTVGLSVVVVAVVLGAVVLKKKED